MTPALETLVAETKALLRAKKQAMHLTDAQIESIRPAREVTPATLPAVESLPAVAALASAETAAVANALIAAAPDLAWRQTYDEGDGFDRRFLETYGWFDLAGPTGPCTADGIRVMMGVWGQGLHYPNHSHPPDEHYLVVAGASWIRLDNDPYLRHGPGEVFHTPPNAVHAADMRDAPLLAIAVWKGEDTSVQINLTELDRDISKA